jgi:transcription elongation factor
MFLPYGWMPWVALMKQYDKAKAKLEEGSEEAMITFYNTRLALCWERTKETTKYDELMARAGGYRSARCRPAAWCSRRRSTARRTASSSRSSPGARAWRAGSSTTR